MKKSKSETNKSKERMPRVRKRLPERQLAAFRAKFGRKPRPGDPLFFDPDSDTLQPLSPEKFRDHVIAAAIEAGIDPARAIEMLGLDQD